MSLNGKSTRKKFHSALIKFREADYAYDRVHVDFLGPFHGKTYFIVVDAYSKWPEVFEMGKQIQKVLYRNRENVLRALACHG